MPKESRHHHYLSQCYLRGFTKSGSKKSKLTVFDLKREKVFKTNTRNVGGVRDFDRINIDGIESDIINKQLSGFESQVALSLRKIEQNLSFEGQDRENILNLIALLSARSPQRREHWRKFQEEIIKSTLGMMVSSKDTWESRSSQKNKKNDNNETKITYEEAREFHEKDQYKVTLSTEHHLEMEMLAIDTILPLLAQRNWLLVKTPHESCPFITSDRPVFLVWKYPDKIPPFYRESPGHGMRETQIQFPVSHNLTLVGEFDGKEGVIQADKKFVSILNSKMLLSIHERIFSPKKDFYFVDFRGNMDTLLKGSSLFSYVRKCRTT